MPCHGPVSLQVSNNRDAKAENTTLRNELSALQEKLSTSSRQLEAEQATSRRLPQVWLPVLASQL